METLRGRRNTRDGRMVFWGSLAQIPAALLMGWMAWRTFPQGGSDDLLFAGLFHLVTPVALVGTFIKYGAQLNFRPSSVLTVLLALIAAVPFALSLPRLP